jgi:chaperonin GroES
VVPHPAEARDERHGEDSMHVRPLHDRLVVQRLDEAEQRVGGIIIPDSAKEKPQQGTVIAAGHGKATNAGKRIPLDIKAGDRILFGKFSGQEIRLDGKEYLFMKADDVLAVIEGPTIQKQTVIAGRTKQKTTKTTTKKSAAIRSKGTSMKKAQRKPKKKR